MSSSIVEIAPGIRVHKVAHGLMMMTGKPDPISDEECFAAIKAGIDSLPAGVKMVINSGEFYARDLSTANLELVSRFFEAYPAYADRAFLSVKGAATKDGKFHVDSSLENIRNSVDNCIRALRGMKKIDMFECARVDKNVPIEDVMKSFELLIREGKFDYIGMSECRAETIRRAAKVARITGVEIEVSPMSYEEETKKGRVIAACGELGIVVFGYSPVGRGIITSAPLSLDNMHENDIRKHYPRFQPDAYAHNLQIVNAIKALGEKRGATPAQLSIAWVGSLGSHVVPLPGSSNASRTLENAKSAEIRLTPAEIDEVIKAIETVGVKGDRYSAAQMSLLWG